MMFYCSVIFLLLGGTIVFYSLSPYYGALGMVLSSVFGCVILGLMGLSFLALLLLLVFMGGMMIVFIFSGVLSADRFPLVSNFFDILFLFLLIFFWVLFIFEDSVGSEVGFGLVGYLDLYSLGILYDFDGFYLLVGALALLVVLVLALLVSFGESNSSLRAL